MLVKSKKESRKLLKARLALTQCCPGTKLALKQIRILARSSQFSKGSAKQSHELKESLSVLFEEERKESNGTSNR